ncbi:hypothetical protein GUJ93_ZPchr0254g2866 [Zizania palustris]|uniref:Uncharacterized protein n=3 Tax=Zizania palustris TaxID=103762 RepID=A0A8J5QQW5_ZIZPA|nr:hypothetical protein GUJ93_ZPchr0254g2866 [Zizania palustris]
MGKKRGDHVPDAVGAARAGNQAVSIREENSGKTRADAASLLRLQHLQRLAAWACGEAGVAPVSALLGRRLAGEAEAAGIPLGASTFVCQRCETVLQPGFNCTIRLSVERNENEEMPTPNLLNDSLEGVVSLSVELNQSATATEQEDISQKTVVSITDGKCIKETESITAVKIKVCESDVLLKAEFPVGSTFVTPQKRKLMDVMDPKDSAELLETRSMQTKKGERSGSVNGKAPTPSTKCAPNNKPVASGSSQTSGSSRKRARKGWTTLKQIAEKEELERKEKMGSFVIPFFMQV